MRLPGLLCAAIAISAPSVASAAYVDVSASWGVYYGYNSDQPDAIDIEGGGDELTDIHTFTGKENQTLTSTSSFSVTNTLDTPFHDYNFWLDLSFSSFNPGGDEIGLSLDNTKEVASFSSVVSSDLLGELDRHGCNLPASYADGYTYFSPTTCGVTAPDSSDYPIYIGDLGPHETQTFSFTITISDSFASVPEPSVLAIFGPMTLGLGLFLRKRPRRSHPE